MSKIAEAYNTLNPDAKKWYEAAAKRSFAKYSELREDQKKQASANEKKVDGRRRAIVYDTPADPAEGLPTGWTTRVFRRKGQHNKSDRFWYSPIQLFRFRSMVKVEQFLERLNGVNGDEVMAYKLCNDRTKNCATTNSTDLADIVVYNRKIAKKRAKRATNLPTELVKATTELNSPINNKKKTTKRTKTSSEQETNTPSSVRTKRHCNAFSLCTSDKEKNCTVDSTNTADIDVYDRKIAKRKAAKINCPKIEKKKSTKKKKPLEIETTTPSNVKPKCPCNAFSLYAKEVKDQVRAAHPDLKYSEIVSERVSVGLRMLSIFAVSNIAFNLFRCVKLLTSTMRLTTKQKDSTRLVPIAILRTIRENSVTMQWIEELALNSWRVCQQVGRHASYPARLNLEPILIHTGTLLFSHTFSHPWRR